MALDVDGPQYLRPAIEQSLVDRSADDKEREMLSGKGRFINLQQTSPM
jgi:hypothetical protein